MYSVHVTSNLLICFRISYLIGFFSWTPRHPRCQQTKYLYYCHDLISCDILILRMFINNRSSSVNFLLAKSFYFNQLLCFSITTKADCPMATCNHAELGGERLYRSAIHSLISPRFLKSQSALGGNGTKEFDRCLIRSQPASNSGSTRLVYFACVQSPSQPFF